MKLMYVKIAAGIMCGLCLLIQIFLIICFWDMEQISDCGQYYNYAYDCFQNGEFYPMHKHLYSPYLFAPGFVNFLVLQLNVFGTLKFNVVSNLLMSWGIAAELFYLGKKIFNERTAYLSLICYSCLYSTWMYILPMATEIPFLFLMLAALCLCLKNRPFYIILAGCCLALGNWIRPLAIIFIPSILMYMYTYRYSRKHYACLLISAMVCILVIGSYTYNKIGYFTFQSSTSGYNLLATANDMANGGFVTCKEHYLENKDKIPFSEKDSIWKSKATEWIKQHPDKYVKMYLFKIAGLYSHDAGIDGFIWKDLNKINYSHMQLEGKSYTSFFLIKALKSTVYYLIVLSFGVTIIKKRKEMFSRKGILLIILLLGTSVTCLFPVMTRYHYPFLWVIILWAAYGIASFMRKREIDKALSQ